MDKVFPNIAKAVADIPDGASIAIGGFFTAGTPLPLIQALAQQGAKNLTIICMQMGPGNEEVNQLVLNKQIKKAICNYPFFRSATRGVKSPFEVAVRAGEIDLEVYPMGTFVEKLRAGGAGLAGFYTQAGVGTVVEAGKEKRSFNGREYLLELALQVDYALVYAFKADRMGNLYCRKAAKNYNPEMAKAARITIAAVENIVEPGEIDPDMVNVPCLYVNRMVKVERPNYYPTND